MTKYHHLQNYQIIIFTTGQFQIISKMKLNRKILLASSLINKPLISQQLQLILISLQSKSIKMSSFKKILQEGKFYCIANKQVFQACVEEKCKNNPFICTNRECQCQTNTHQQCNFMRIANFTKKIKQKTQAITKQSQITFNAITTIYNQLINQLKDDLAYLEVKMRQYGLREYEKMFCYSMKNNNIQIDSKFMKKLGQQIKLPKLSEQYTLQQIKKDLYKQSIKFNQLCQQIKSILCHDEAKIFHSKITKESFLINQFLQGNAKKINLLYRASQNYFDVRKFHQLCDSKPNIAVIVETQFGKIIGGYTPLPWTSSQTDMHFADPSRKSFLFSITNRQKYPIVTDKGDDAIWCNILYGPIFGNDLCILNNADSNSDSWAKFPTIYNNGKYNNNQLSYKAFSGASSGFNFKIKEWQVFQVEFK